MTNILWHTKNPKNYIFCQSDQKIGIIVIHSVWTAIVVLAAVIFVFYNLREKGSVSLIKIVRCGMFLKFLPHTGWKSLSQDTPEMLFAKQTALLSLSDATQCFPKTVQWLWNTGVCFVFVLSLRVFYPQNEFIACSAETSVIGQMNVSIFWVL